MSWKSGWTTNLSLLQSSVLKGLLKSLKLWWERLLCACLHKLLCIPVQIWPSVGFFYFVSCSFIHDLHFSPSVVVLKFAVYTNRVAQCAATITFVLDSTSSSDSNTLPPSLGVLPLFHSTSSWYKYLFASIYSFPIWECYSILFSQDTRI